jgi:hypothetical protein
MTGGSFRFVGRRSGLALALASGAAALAACGSSVDSGTTTGSASANTGIRFTQCMRGHRITDFPDPLPGGGFPRGANIGQGSPAFQTAQRACQSTLRSNAAQRQPTAAERAAALNFAECMRAHRVPNFPDPMTRSEVPRNTDVIVQSEFMFPVGSSIDPGSPAFQQAASACGQGSPGGSPHGG